MVGRETKEVRLEKKLVLMSRAMVVKELENGVARGVRRWRIEHNNLISTVYICLMQYTYCICETIARKTLLTTQRYGNVQVIIYRRQHYHTWNKNITVSHTHTTILHCTCRQR